MQLPKKNYLAVFAGKKGWQTNGSKKSKTVAKTFNNWGMH
jgi:hypothetical protein